jgi:hypothetical protein
MKGSRLRGLQGSRKILKGYRQPTSAQSSNLLFGSLGFAASRNARMLKGYMKFLEL